jgi:hypothetical protein
VFKISSTPKACAGDSNLLKTPFCASPYDLVSHSDSHACKGTPMKRPDHPFSILSFIATMACCSLSARAQTSADVYNSIKVQPSTIHWCQPQAGDDPAHIIQGRCKVYRECLSNLSLDENIDRSPPSSITPEQVGGVRKCHQALFNAARTNPQIKGSAATQQWLQHSVYPGTEAKSFPVSGNFGDPR